MQPFARFRVCTDERNKSRGRQATGQRDSRERDYEQTTYDSNRSRGIICRRGSRSAAWPDGHGQAHGGAADGYGSRPGGRSRTQSARSRGPEPHGCPESSDQNHSAEREAIRAAHTGSGSKDAAGFHRRHQGQQHGADSGPGGEPRQYAGAIDGHHRQRPGPDICAADARSEVQARYASAGGAGACGSARSRKAAGNDCCPERRGRPAASCSRLPQLSHRPRPRSVSTSFAASSCNRETSTLPMRFSGIAPGSSST